VEVPEDDEALFRAMHDDICKAGVLVNAALNTADRLAAHDLEDLAANIDQNNNERGKYEKPGRETAASSRYLYVNSVKVELAVNELIEKERSECSIFEIAFPHWRFEPEALQIADVSQLMDEVKIAFDVLGMNGQLGWALGFMHGGFDPLERTFSLSLVGIANGPMAASIEQLRAFPSLAGNPVDDDGDEEVQARGGDVRVKLMPLADYGEPLSSLVQTRWPVRLRPIDEYGEEHNFDDCAPIPDHYLVPALTWLDRWTLPDMTLAIGLRFSGQKVSREHTNAFRDRCLNPSRVW